MKVALVICDTSDESASFDFSTAARAAAERLYRRAQTIVNRAASTGLTVKALRLTLSQAKVWLDRSELEATVDLGTGTVWFRRTTLCRPGTDLVAIAQIIPDDPRPAGTNKQAQAPRWR